MILEQPSLWLLAGPNGSGKSTFYHRNLADRVAIFVNADEIAKTLTGYATQQERDLAAMHLAEEQRRQLLREKKDFAAETVFSHPSKVDLIREAKAAGFIVSLVFICTDNAAINLGRVQQRVQQGGHSVPPDKIAARYARALDHLREALPLVDHVFLYDNSVAGQEHLLVAEIEQRLVSQRVDRLPHWVERTFPEGLQTYLDSV